jgi:hypothetical protein
VEYRFLRRKGQVFRQGDENPKPEVRRPKVGAVRDAFLLTFLSFTFFPGLHANWLQFLVIFLPPSFCKNFSPLLVWLRQLRISEFGFRPSFGSRASGFGFLQLRPLHNAADFVLPRPNFWKEDKANRKAKYYGPD